MNWFTSDLHFGSNDILWREDRPFENIEDFEEYCFKIWNENFDKDDYLYIIGDFCNYSIFAPISLEKIIETYKLVNRINANVILIIGNNDQRIIDKFFNGDFENFKKLLISFGFKDALRKRMFLLVKKLFI